MPDKKTILIAEDHSVNRKILNKLLTDEYRILEAENGEEAWSMLEHADQTVAAVLLDLRMPVLDGFGFLERIKQDQKYKNLPIIVATAYSEAEAETHALELGAWDFVIKPYHEQILKFRLRNAIIRSQFSAFEQLKYQSEYDVLTGIFNKTKFFEMTERLLQLYPKRTFALVRFDIDRFQLLNNFFGMEEGDRLLRFIAGLLVAQEEKNRGFYTYGRIGGDVFAFCCEADSRADLIRRIDSLRAQMKSFNASFNIVSTFGVCFPVNPESSISELLDFATLAAKSCKGNYMDSISFYNEKMSRKLEQEQEIINDMSQALAEGQFCVYFQPKYALSTNSLCGAEALVRWNHPTKGLISPGSFIPIFEKNGFIAELDYFVWETTCRMLRSWLDFGKNVFPVSVNMSRVNMYNPQIVDRITELVDRYHLPPRLFELEVTESGYMENPQIMKNVIDQLRRRGFAILMDDFGSGYSSLSILKDINVDELKIDMRFMGDSEISGRGENIVASIIRMSKWLNLQVTAEGVEKLSQVEFLRSVGCESIQGYFFARPMPVQEYEKLLWSSRPMQELSAPAVHGMDELWNSTSENNEFFENSPHASCIFEFDGQKIELLRVNKAYTRLLGASGLHEASEIIYGVLPEYRDEILICLRQCAKNQNVTDCSYWVQTQDGRKIWIHHKIQFMRQVGDRTVFWGSLADVTEQKNTALRLQQFEQAVISPDAIRRKVLLIDDCEADRQVLCRILSNDFEMLIAADGAVGLEMLHRNTSDIALIVLDLNVSEMTGEEFLLRKNDWSEALNIPVMVVSSEEGTTVQSNMLKLGVRDYLIKPFLQEIVAFRVRNVLEYNSRFLSLAQEYREASFSERNINRILHEKTYSAQELHFLVRFLTPIFEMVRVVDPATASVLTFEENGSVSRKPNSCFSVWNRDTCCENCSSRCALQSSCRTTKYEQIQDDFFHVISNPILLDNSGKKTPVVVEMVNHVSDANPSSGNQGKTIRQLIHETQMKIYTDELSTLFNRRYLHEMLFLSRNLPVPARQIGLVMLDLRDFKSINDQYGHAVGDRVIVDVAKQLLAVIRKNDSAIRYGGDEFIVVLTNCNEEQVAASVERMRSAIQRVRYGDQNEYCVHGEFGYAYDADGHIDDVRLAEMLRIADKKMYAEKMKKSVVTL